MKSAVYKKAGQVGIEEVKRPSIQEADDVIIRVVRACVCGSDLWSYRNPDIKEGHKNSGHEAIGIVEEIGEAISPVILSLPLSHMVVASVMPVVRALMVLVTDTLVTTFLVVYKLSISASTMPIEHLSKYLDNRLTTQKECLSLS